MSSRALILVDLQNDYFPGGKYTLVAVDAAAAQAARLLAAARAAGDLVIHVRHVSESDADAFFTPGSQGAETNPVVASHAGEHVVVKHQINAFRDTNLQDLLDRNGVKEVIVAGAMSHMCVDAITRAAVDFGYSAIVAHDAVATRDLEFNGITVTAAEVHAAFMAALAFGYATVLSTEEVLVRAGDREPAL